MANKHLLPKKGVARTRGWKLEGVELKSPAIIEAQTLRVLDKLSQLDKVDHTILERLITQTFGKENRPPNIERTIMKRYEKSQASKV